MHAFWAWDSSGKSNRFGLIFGADVSGLTTGSALAAILNGLVSTWKPGKGLFMGTIVVISLPIWGWPIGVTWGAGGRTWGGGSGRFVAPT